MEVKDLMIGDWVDCLTSTHKERCFAQIEAIEEYHSILVVKENANWFLDKEVIEPILLTKEILEKNGFKWLITESKCVTYCVNEPTIHCTQHKDNREWFICVGPSGSIKKRFVEVSCVKYVHELQHALRLCGIEKEIVV